MEGNARKGRRLPKRLMERYEAAQIDPELLSHGSDVALIKARAGTDGELVLGQVRPAVGRPSQVSRRIDDAEAADYPKLLTTIKTLVSKAAAPTRRYRGSSRA